MHYAPTRLKKRARARGWIRSTELIPDFAATGFETYMLA